MSDQFNSDTRIQAQFEVPLELCGTRIDQVLAKFLPDYSRERIKEWLINGNVVVDGFYWKPKNKVVGGEKIAVNAEIKPNTKWFPELLDMNIVYEDEQIIVVNKPSGLVVHPGHGNPSGTLVNALLASYPELAFVPRAGIVHRLDKETSGLLAVARSMKAQTSLVNQLKARSMSRKYLALVFGHPKSEGTIDAAIGRHRTQRTKMAVSSRGKDAITHYRVLETTAHCSWVQASLESGRTHQIRVHMTHIGHPLVGDSLYRQSRPNLNYVTAVVRSAINNFPRQALHAQRLGLIHPQTGAQMRWKADPPFDLIELKSILKSHDT